MARETTYDEVFDAQQHFRTIFDAMARPGKVNPLEAVAISPPEGFSRGATLIAFALLNSDVTYHLAQDCAEIEFYLRGNTGVRPSAADQADFIFGSPATTQALIERAKEGDPMYPETSASFVITVEQLGNAPFEGSLSLKLEGPGIDGEKLLCVAGLSPAWVHELKVKNSEFPLGVDILFTADHPEASVVACLPRTSKISIA